MIKEYWITIKVLSIYKLTLLSLSLNQSINSNHSLFLIQTY